MVRKHWLTLYRCAVLIALLASSLLYVHYLAPADSDFCGDSGGCELVRRSGFSYFGSPYLNIPLLGIVAYAVLFGLALGSPGPRRSELLRVLSGVGGVLALCLLIWQAVLIGAFCWLCVIVDGAAVAVAFLAHVAHRERAEQQSLLRPWAWGALATLTVALPLGWYAVRPLPPVPGPIGQLYTSGKVNVIEFADFQCPYCRRIHPIIKELVEANRDKIAFRRLHMPLPTHAEAEAAARAALCAASQGQEEPMADLLFEGRLGDEHYRKYAEQLKLDVARFEACLQDPAVQARIDADIERFRSAGLRGLPTTFIGPERITGARPATAFKEALEKALSAQPPFAPSGTLYLAVSAVLVAALLFFGRVTSKPTASPRA